MFQYSKFPPEIRISGMIFVDMKAVSHTDAKGFTLLELVVVVVAVIICVTLLMAIN